MFTVKYCEEQYKNLSNSELLEILETPSRYQSTAINAAKNGLNLRRLSNNDLEDAKEALAEKEQELLRKRESQDLLINKVNAVSNVVFDTLNPINTTSSATAKTWRLITVSFGLLLIYKIISQYGFFKSIILEQSKEQYRIAVYFIPLWFCFVQLFYLDSKDTLAGDYLCCFALSR